jgi:acetyl esterase/lipase
VCLCPGFDLTGAEHLAGAGAGAATVATLLRSASAYLAGHPAEDPVVNPLAADLSGLPPLLIQAGTGDFGLPQARALADHARRHGVDARLELYAADTHVFQVFWSFLPEAADALAQAGAFTREVLGAERTVARRERPSP